MAFETGHCVSQIVHLTQWSSDPRISSFEHADRSCRSLGAHAAAPAGAPAAARARSGRRASRWRARCPRPTPRATAPRPASAAPATSTFSAPVGAQLRVDRDPDPRHRLLGQVVADEARARPPPARRGAAGRGRARAWPSASRARSRRTPNPPAASTNQGASVVGVVAGRLRCATDGHARAVTFARHHLGAEHEPPAGAARSALRRISYRRMPGTDGGSVGISNTRASEPVLEVGPGAMRIAEPEHRGQADALVGLELQRKPRPRTRARQRGIVELPREPERVHVGALGLQLERRPSAPSIPASARGWPRRARHGSRAARACRPRTRARAAARVAGGHRLGHDAPRAAARRPRSAADGCGPDRRGSGTPGAARRRRATETTARASATASAPSSA